jgi:hypothetical protein
LKNRLQYIFSFFLILSLLGLRENVIITCPNVKNIRDTEWITKTSSNVKVTKCYHYHQCSGIIIANSNLHSWSNAISIFYSRILNIKFLSQAKKSYLTDLMNLVSSKLYSPRISIEYHHISNKRTDLSQECCLSSEIRHDAGNIMWNFLLKRRWINQQINPSVFLMELSALQNGFGG